MYNAKLYHENNNFQKKWVPEAFEKHGSKINWKKDSNKIIDLGCGEGTVITIMRKYFPNNVTIVGCDINEDMIKLAKEYYGDEQTSFIILNIEGDVPDNFRENFSHVFSFFALQWVMDQGRAFSNIYNFLEPGGECFLVIVTYNTIFEVYRSLEINNKWNTWVYDTNKYISPYHDSQDPKPEVTKLIKKVGFKINVMEHDEMVYVFNDMEAFKRSLKAINPFKIPLEKENEFWEDYVQLWKVFEYKETDFSPKHIKFTTKTIIVHATKTKDSMKNN